LSVQAIIWSYGMAAFKKTHREEEERKKLQEAAVLAEIPQVEETTEEVIHVNTVSESNEIPSPIVETTVPPSSPSNSFAQKLKNIREKLPPWSQIITPPMCGCLFGLFVALFPKFQAFLFTDPPVIISIFSYTLNTLGLAMFPLSMMTLGANLTTTILSKVDNPEPVNNSAMVRNESMEQLQVSPSMEIETKKQSFIKSIIRYNDPWALLTALGLRLVMMPLFGLSITFLYYALGIIPKTDPVLFMVLLVQASTPSANNLNMLSILNGGYGIHQVCETLLYMYLISPITLSLFSALYLKLACSFMTSGITCA
jgi:hypothetical protein